MVGRLAGWVFVCRVGVREEAVNASADERGIVYILRDVGEIL